MRGIFGALGLFFWAEVQALNLSDKTLLEVWKNPSLAQPANYGAFRHLIEKNNPQVKVHFVVGRANTQFLTVPENLWEETFGFEDFSFADALGRMLCPQSSRNPSPYFRLIVRADDPGDTLLHEYLHYVQNQDPKREVCALYERLEKRKQGGDEKKNDALENEVVSTLWAQQKILKWGPDVLAQLLEKLSRYQPEKSKKFANQTESQVKAYIQDRKTLSTYQVPPYLEREASKVKISHGIALLNSSPLKKSELPLCVKTAETTDPKLSEALGEALARWNQVAKSSLNQEIFQLGCKKPGQKSIFIEANSTAGRSGDGIFKLGFAFQKGEERILVLRQKEFGDFSRMLKGMIRQELWRDSLGHSQGEALKEKLASFEKQKSQEMLLHFFMHELGHLLGLAHNFNDAEKSIMNYSEQTLLSAYDEEALKLIFNGPRGLATHWRPSLEPPGKKNYIGN